jgi:hypothetical protein
VCGEANCGSLLAGTLNPERFCCELFENLLLSRALSLPPTTTHTTTTDTTITLDNLRFSYRGSGI